MQARNLATIIQREASRYPVITLTGPRQSGKTTLCKHTFPDKPYFNLEAPDIRQFATEDPRGFFAAIPQGAILDEIQRVPELTSYLQPLVDENPEPGRFILTGSQQLHVRASVSQSLAGRTAMLTLLPFDSAEISAYHNLADVDGLLLKGFYPRLHHMGLEPPRMYGDYFETYVQRDVRQLINIRNAGQFEKFIRLCAGRTGQLLNLHSLGNDAGVSHTTAREWITLLEAGYIIFQLPPWHANISKRLTKTPKLYFWDVGLAAFLLGLETLGQVARDPLRGNLFENMIIADLFKQSFHHGKRPRFSFYRDSSGLETDLVMEHGQELFLLEIKSGQTVTQDYFKGLHGVRRAVGERIKGGAVLYGGETAQNRSDWQAWPIGHLPDLLGLTEMFFIDA